VEWVENDALFKKELRQGFKWQLHVAKYFKDLGFDVDVPKLRIRESVNEISEFSDEPDIVWCGRIFEVKSRKVSFTCPADFPYQTIMVDTVSGWKAKEHKPTEYICVSTLTGAIICLGGETQPLWTEREAFDYTRKIRDMFYEADKSLWMPVDIMVRQMECFGRGK